MILYLSRLLDYLVGGAYYTPRNLCSLPRTEEDILADTNYEETETYFPYYLSRNVSTSTHARAYSFRLLREEDE